MVKSSQAPEIAVGSVLVLIYFFPGSLVNKNTRFCR